MTKRILRDDLREALKSHLATLEDLPEGVWKRTSALNTWGTNALEGNTLSAAEVDQLLLENKSVSGHTVSEVVETLQHERAFRSLLERRSRPLDLVLVQELHEEVFRGIETMRPGQWRLTNPHIGGTTYRPPRRERIVARMEAWLAEYRRRDRAKEDVFALGAWLHHEFEAVHPFEDGNGRVGRLLVNLHFLRHDWPPVHLTPADREAYLAALEAGHADDYRPLQDLLEHAMAASLLDLLDQVGSSEDALRPLADFNDEAWNPYDAHYLSMRARQGALGAVRTTRSTASAASRQRGGRARYLTSERALRHYIRTKGRSDALDRVKEND